MSGGGGGGGASKKQNKTPGIFTAMSFLAFVGSWLRLLSLPIDVLHFYQLPLKSLWAAPGTKDGRNQQNYSQISYIDLGLLWLWRANGIFLKGTQSPCFFVHFFRIYAGSLWAKLALGVSQQALGPSVSRQKIDDSALNTPLSTSMHCQPQTNVILATVFAECAWKY